MRSCAFPPLRYRTLRCEALARADTGRRSRPSFDLLPPTSRDCRLCQPMTKMDYDIFRRDGLRSAPMIDAAMVGLGRWGKGIVEAAQGKSKRLRFVRGICKEPYQLADFAKTHGLKLGTELSEAIADPQVQAIFLATPHSLHVDQICAVAAAGKPVWCEKPLARPPPEAEQALAAVTAAKVPFGLGNNKRFFSSMRELKRVVADGVIG